MPSCSFYRPQRSCGQGNIFTPVCHSFCSQGGRGSASVHAGIPPPQEETPQTRQNPPGPDTTTPPLDQTPRDQTPPREADFSIRSTSARYASYWNVFLFFIVFKIKLLKIYHPQNRSNFYRIQLIKKKSHRSVLTAVI